MQIVNRAVATVLLAHAFMYASASIAQSVRDAEEPATGVIESGKCKVAVCADIDFGDHLFRNYASQRVRLSKHIPKGVCECNVVKNGIYGFNDSLLSSVETRDGKIFHNISLIRIRTPPRSRADAYPQTSWEHFQKVRPGLVEFSDFKWNDDNFSGFKIFVDPRIYPSNIRKLYFVSVQRQFKFRNETQPIVFYTALGYKFGDENSEKDGPNVVARVQLTNSIHLFEFFVPRLVRSSEWISSMEKVAEAIDARLLRKPD